MCACERQRGGEEGGGGGGRVRRGTDGSREDAERIEGREEGEEGVKDKYVIM